MKELNYIQEDRNMEHNGKKSNKEMESRPKDISHRKIYR